LKNAGIFLFKIFPCLHGVNFKKKKTVQ
jgi:hypothetical protein